MLILMDLKSKFDTLAASRSTAASVLTPVGWKKPVRVLPMVAATKLLHHCQQLRPAIRLPTGRNEPCENKLFTKPTKNNYFK